MREELWKEWMEQDHSEARPMCWISVSCGASPEVAARNSEAYQRYHKVSRCGTHIINTRAVHGNWSADKLLKLLIKRAEEAEEAAEEAQWLAEEARQEANDLARRLN